MEVSTDENRKMPIERRKNRRNLLYQKDTSYFSKVQLNLKQLQWCKHRRDDGKWVKIGIEGIY